MIRKETYTNERIFPFILASYNGKGRNRINLDGDLITVSSLRLYCFAVNGIECVYCGIKGSFFAKEKHAHSDRNYHLNFYSKVGGKDVLMTMDHIIPKSRGGKNTLENVQTMCSPCNTKKGDLLSLYDSEFKLTKIGADLSKKSFTALSPLFNKYMEMGFSPREISHVIAGALKVLEVHNVNKK